MMTETRRGRTKSWFGLIAALAVLSSMALGAGTAVAQDNSKRELDCTLYAYDPTADYAANTATASGRVQCDTRHVIVITVHLQIYKAGKWTTSVKASNSVRGEYGVSKSVTGGCSRFPNYYRTKTVASVDGRKNVSVVTVNDYLVCPLSPQ